MASLPKGTPSLMRFPFRWRVSEQTLSYTWDVLIPWRLPCCIALIPPEIRCRIHFQKLSICCIIHHAGEGSPAPIDSDEKAV